jgi:hypothetical protein
VCDYVQILLLQPLPVMCRWRMGTQMMSTDDVSSRQNGAPHGDTRFRDKEDRIGAIVDHVLESRWPRVK